MKTLTLLLVPFFCLGQIPEDKIAHYTWGFLGGVPTYYIYYDTAGMHPVLAIAATTGTAALAGWGFEHYQKQQVEGCTIIWTF